MKDILSDLREIQDDISKTQIKLEHIAIRLSKLYKKVNKGE